MIFRGMMSELNLLFCCSCSEESGNETLPSRKRKANTNPTGQKNKKRKAAVSLEPNPLDMTSIHPESYHIADRLV